MEALAPADVRAAFGGWLSRAGASGTLPRVEAAGLRAETVQQWCAAFRAVQAWEAWQAHGPWLREHPGSLGADVAERFAIAAGVSGESAAAGRRIVRAARGQVTRWLCDGVVVIPTAPGAARGSDLALLGLATAATTGDPGEKWPGTRMNEEPGAHAFSSCSSITAGSRRSGHKEVRN